MMKNLSKKHSLLFYILFLLIQTAIITAMSLYFSAATYEKVLFFSYFRYPTIFLLNYLPFLLFELFIFFLVNKSALALTLSNVIIIVCSIVNHFKILFRGEPVQAAELGLMAEAMSISDDMKIRLTPLMIGILIAAVLGTLLAYALPRFSISRLKIRLAGLAVTAGLFILLFNTVFTNVSIWNSTTHGKDIKFESGYVMSQSWNMADKFCSRGSIYPFLYSFRYITNEKPEGYSKKEQAEIYNSFETEDIPENQKVNIFSIMLESYSDFSKLDNLDFDTDPYTAFHEIEKEGLSGTLISNTFAGGTYNAERCYITGSLKMYNSYRKPTMSYARYFKDQGYFTEYCHPYYSWFYSRRNVEEYLGFDARHFEEDSYPEPKVGRYPDSKLFNNLLELLDQSVENGDWYFNQTVTLQNHGLYNYKKLDNPNTIYVPQGDMSDSTYISFNNYLNGINDTSKQLRVFLDELNKREAPCVVVLFGDHKPYLGTSWDSGNEGAYKELGINIDSGTEDGFYTRTSTPWVIWANDAAREKLNLDLSGDGGTFSPCFLMMKLFDTLHLKGDANIQVLRELYPKVDIINDLGVYRENGELVEKPSAEAEALIKKISDLQYYRYADLYKDLYDN